MESGHVSPSDYNDKLMIKADKYMKSDSIKQLRPDISDLKANGHFDLYPFDRVSKSHVLSLICYCDLTNFSREWSSTFRFIRFGESIKQLKDRNSRFYFCSKYMIEIVNVFGMSGPSLLNHNLNGHETGPFYCGLNVPLLFPSYVTRFCGPCSTSKQLTVATRFADTKGVIISVTNKYNEYLHFLIAVG